MAQQRPSRRLTQRNQHAIDASLDFQRSLLVFLQLQHGFVLVDLRLLHIQLRLDRLFIHIDLIAGDLVPGRQFIRRRLRFVISQATDHTQAEELFVRLRLQLRLAVIGVHSCRRRLFVHQGALQGRLQVVISHLVGFQL